MKKKFSTIILCVIFLIGLTILIYPTVSSYYNEKISSYAIAEYSEKITDLNVDETEAILKRAEEYNKELLNKSVHFINGEPSSPDYLSELNVDDNNMIGVIEIKKINVYLPIYHGTAEPVLQKAIGHLEGSSLPIGGIGNHSVLSGHRGLPSAKLFTNLDKLEVGDMISIKVYKKTIYYKVKEISVVEPQEIELLKPESNKDLLTLVTCTPYGVNSHRLLLTAERSEDIEEESIDVISNKNEWKSALIILISIISIILIALKIRKINKNRT
ncbi:class C sortase [Clostridium sp. LP20]|uniref:class C sortase n=1 Tax=Clostridium sp. LP20 TaxID=3418665 RepID=UPI003EE81084